MCLDPVTLAALTFAATAAQGVMSYQNAKAQANYTEQSNALVQKQTEQAQDERRNAEQRQMADQYQADAAQASQYQLDALRTRGTLDALLGEYGGATADRRLATLDVRQNQDLATLRGNASKAQQEISLGSRSDLISIANHGASSKRGVASPSLFGAGLTIAGAGLQFGDRMNTINNPAPRAGTK